MDEDRGDGVGFGGERSGVFAVSSVFVRRNDCTNLTRDTIVGFSQQ